MKAVRWSWGGLEPFESAILTMLLESSYRQKKSGTGFNVSFIDGISEG
jgi:hypothetical protein